MCNLQCAIEDQIQMLLTMKDM